MLFQLGTQAGDQLHHERFDGQQLGIVIQHQADALRLRLGQRLGRAVRLPAQFMGTCSTLARVPSETPGLPLRAYETALLETPDALATSKIVTLFF